MNLPIQNSNRFRVLEILFRHGSMTAKQIREHMPAAYKSGTDAALIYGREHRYIIREKQVYTLAEDVRNQILDMALREYVDAIVAGPTISFNAWTPEMKGYEANLMRLRRTA